MDTLTQLPLFSHGPLGDRPGEKFVYLSDLVALFTRLELEMRKIEDPETSHRILAITYETLRETFEAMR